MQIFVRKDVDNADFREEYGLLISFIHENDHRPMREQFDERYAHGGGWRPFGKDKFRMLKNGGLVYPGDPTFKPLAILRHHEERAFIYEHAIVCIVQPDGTFEVSRLD
jgi:hypothetical protein